MSPAGSSIPATTIAALVEQLARQVHNLSFTRELAPVQWSALRYLAKAGPLARTVSGLAAYSGVNLSSASRTIQLLKRKGLVSIEPVPQDSRVKRVTLTAAGHDLLSRDPLGELATMVETTLDPAETAAFAAMVEKLLFGFFPKPFRSPFR